MLVNLSANTTQGNQPDSLDNSDLWNTLILAFIASVAVGVSAFSLWSQRKHQQFERLVKVYSMINDTDEREARKNVYKAYRIYYSNYVDEWDNIQYANIMDNERKRHTSVTINAGQVYDDIFTDCEVMEALGQEGKRLQKDVERVRATFDHIGTLFDGNLIPKKPLLEALWGTARVCWICLHDNIMIERDKRGTEYYMVYFHYLFDKIEEYRIEKVLEPVTPYREDETDDCI